MPDTNRDIVDFLLKFASVKALARPSDSVHRYLHDWMIENRPLHQGEDDFIYLINDLVFARRSDEYNPQQGSQIDAFIEKYLAGDSKSFIHVCSLNAYHKLSSKR
jgi:hypothetical protein